MDTITTEEALAVLQDAPVAHLGVVIDGNPYVTPMSFIVEGDRILFRTLPGRKLEGLRSHPAVCIEVSRYNDTTGDWVSVIVKGTARVVDDDETGRVTIDGLMHKYRDVIGSGLQVGGMHPIIGLPYVVEVTIDELSGLCSGRGLAPRTRPGRL